MNSSDPSRRVRGALTRRQLIAWSSLSIGVAGAGRAFALDGEPGISRSAEAIHQEPSFSASAHALYQALTDEKQFERFMALSEAVQSKAVAPQPVRIEARAGGAFSLFGGYISGRFLELVPEERDHVRLFRGPAPETPERARAKLQGATTPPQAETALRANS